MWAFTCLTCEQCRLRSSSRLRGESRLVVGPVGSLNCLVTLLLPTLTLKCWHNMDFQKGGVEEIQVLKPSCTVSGQSCCMCL